MGLNIRNEKVVLRAVEPEDIDLLYKWENETDVWTISNTITPFSKDLLRRYIESAQMDIYESKQLRLMIQASETCKTIGCVDLFELDIVNYRAGVGILISDIEERGNGFAKEALSLIINYCFETLNLKQIYCNILSDNVRSISLFERMRFEKVGIKKSWVRDGSQWKDELLYQLINEKKI